MQKDDHVIQDIRVIGVEKPQKNKLQQHFEYVIRVVYLDGDEHLIFRRYSMLFDFHAVLKEFIKDSYSSVVVLPELPVARFQHVGRKFLRLNMSKEIKRMTEFLQKIIQLPKFISEKDIIVKFFDELGTDRAHAEACQEEYQIDSSKEQNEAQLPQSPSTSGSEGPFGQNDDASQDTENQFKAVAEFLAHSTGELSVTCGEIVTVIEKNTSGWWLVSNMSGLTGFTPATFLEPLDQEKQYDAEEWIDIKGPDNVYVAVKNYQAQCPDEISFNIGEELEVISMSNFGWWRVRRGNQVGLSPASSLSIKKGRQSSASGYTEDPMNEYRKSIHNMSKKSSHRAREAPPRTSTKSESSDLGDPEHVYSRLNEDKNHLKPEENGCSVKYTQVIPKHLRPKEVKEDQKTNDYVNVPVIKEGVPHYSDGSENNETEPINVYLLRKDYQGHGLSLREGDTVQVIAVMPDGCHWKVATLTPGSIQEGLVPADLLCPELPGQMRLADTSPPPVDKPVFTPEATPFRECPGDNRQPVVVLSKFTRPPSNKTNTVLPAPGVAKKPIPKPRPCGNKSPAAAYKGMKVVASQDYVSPNAQNELLAFKKGDVARLVKCSPESGWWLVELRGQEGWVPHSYWKDVKESGNERKIEKGYIKDKAQWFCGKMSRQECEDIFDKSGKHLNFIIRESVQRVGSYVLSIRFNDKIHHFPIEMSQSGKLTIGKLSFDRLSEIVAFYASHPLFYTDHRQPVSIGEPLVRT